MCVLHYPPNTHTRAQTSRLQHLQTLAVKCPAQSNAAQNVCVHRSLILPSLHMPPPRQIPIFSHFHLAGISADPLVSNTSTLRNLTQQQKRRSMSKRLPLGQLAVGSKRTGMPSLTSRTSTRRPGLPAKTSQIRHFERVSSNAFAAEIPLPASRS